jgi:hypothetical protein
MILNGCICTDSMRYRMIPILYVQMDGTGVPVVKKETLGRPGKTEGQPAHTWEVKLGCNAIWVFLPPKNGL